MQSTGHSPDPPDRSRASAHGKAPRRSTQDGAAERASRPASRAGMCFGPSAVADDDSEPGEADVPPMEVRSVSGISPPFTDP